MLLMAIPWIYERTEERFLEWALFSTFAVRLGFGGGGGFGGFFFFFSTVV